MKHLIILHGAIGAAAQLGPLAEALSAHYKIHTLDFSGHGSKLMPDKPFSIPMFAGYLLEYMAQQQLENVCVLGYSMGGYVAMYIAAHYFGKIEKIITLGTKYEWSEAIAAKEVQMMIPGKIEQKLPAFAATLARRHALNGWELVLSKTTALMVAMGVDNPLKLADLPKINIPVLLLIGDRDKMSTLDETVTIYKALPNAQMGVLPDTPHPVEQVNIRLLGLLVTNFLDQ